MKKWHRLLYSGPSFRSTNVIQIWVKISTISVNYFWKTPKLKNYLDMFFPIFTILIALIDILAYLDIMYFTSCDIGIKLGMARAKSQNQAANQLLECSLWSGCIVSKMFTSPQNYQMIFDTITYKGIAVQIKILTVCFLFISLY